MFDKILFNRNAFDRSVSSEGFNSTIISYSECTCKIIIWTPISFNWFVGSGNIISNVVIQQNLKGLNIVGTGEIGATTIILRTDIGAKILSSGSLVPGIIAKNPFILDIAGNSSMKIDNRMYLIQFMKSNISGNSSFINNLNLQFSMFFRLRGSSNFVFSNAFKLDLPLNFSLKGFGEIKLRRLGTLNENVIELIGLNFQPGETITIDTDLLQVLFGVKEDVSSVTTESVFFELNPGENEVTISTDTEETLEVVAIWQNRWL